MKKEGFLFFAVFFAGVFLANLLKYKAGNLCRILNIWILEQFAYSSISLERLFWQLFWKRGKFTFFSFLLGEWCGYVVASTACLCLLTGTFGFFLTMAIADLGIRGVAFAFVSVFPHAFFYVAAVLSTSMPDLLQFSAPAQGNEKKPSLMLYFSKQSLVSVPRALKT